MYQQLRDYFLPILWRMRFLNDGRGLMTPHEHSEVTGSSVARIRAAPRVRTETWKPLVAHMGCYTEVVISVLQWSGTRHLNQ